MPEQTTSSLAPPMTTQPHLTTSRWLARYAAQPYTRVSRSRTQMARPDGTLVSVRCFRRAGGVGPAALSDVHPDVVTLVRLSAAEAD